MSYESRVIIAKPYKDGYDESTGLKGAGIISIFNLGCCGLKEAFDNYDKYYVYDLFADDDKIVSTDKYGDPLRMATIDQVIKFIKADPEIMELKRIKPFYKYLKSMKKNHMDEGIYLLHYGY